jgi:hypothetical protein
LAISVFSFRQFRTPLFLKFDDAVDVRGHPAMGAVHLYGLSVFQNKFSIEHKSRFARMERGWLG